MSNYPLHKLNHNSGHLYPQTSFYSNEAADSLCTLHLRSELYKGTDGKHHTAYRLHAHDSHTLEDTFGYVVHCPRCSTHVMKQVGRCLDSHTLGLYTCPACEKY